MMAAVQNDSDDELILDDDGQPIINVHPTSHIKRFLSVHMKGFLSNISVEPVIFLYFVGTISYAATVQQYVYSEIGKQHGIIGGNSSSSYEACMNDTGNQTDTANVVQSESSTFNLINTVVGIAPAFVVTMLLGRYSGYKGRRVAIIVPLLGGVLKAFITVLVAYLEGNLYWLVAATLLESFCGGSMLLCMACFSYISDVSSVKTRSMRILITQAAVILGIAASSISTGYIIRQVGFNYAFLFGLAALAVNAVFAILCVKETITVCSDVKLFSATHIVETFRVYSRDDGNNRRWKLLTMLVIIVITYTADIGLGDVTALFLLHQPLCFTPVLLGYYQCVTSILKGIWGIVLMKMLHKVLQDTGLIIWGCVAGVAMGVLMAFSYNIIMVFTVPLLNANTPLVLPLCLAFSSKLVQKPEIASLFAAMTFAQQLSSFLGGLFFTMLYSKTVAFFAGTTFLLGSGLFVIALLSAIALHLGIRKERIAGDSVASYTSVNTIET